jgi:N-6 DNA Methylase
LFAELGYGRLARSSALNIDGHDYPVSHIWGPVPLHLLGADVELDRRTKGVAGAAGASPHSMLQDLLNRSGQYLWGIVSNGRILRVLRDNTSLTRAAYVEFDLEDMFSGQVFADFAVLWMVCHQSRFEADRPELCWEETWVTESKRQGVRALDTLRAGFERAIIELGGGFLANPLNVLLRDRLRAGELATDDYQRQILRLVYRLVFLLVAEDRDLLHVPGTTDRERDLYARYYSLGRLRGHARRHRGGRHGDLWESLKPVFSALDSRGIPQVRLPPLGSFLWSPEACPDLDHARLSNNVLLGAVRRLAYTQREQTLDRVDFVNLGPEELGSVYESLLELHPRVEVDAARFELITAIGNERKSTGSYYTPTSLIMALLDEALDPLLDEAEKEAEPAEAILAVKVLDPACGSGHFLTAAAQRIATRLAAVQTGEVNPPPQAVRHALRQVVGRCVYGIDLNPMAVELAKVNLWLDAVEPGLPLSFLDHHIVCGNAVIGATPRLLVLGVPDDAFRPLEGDDKPTATARKRSNRVERLQRNQGLLALGGSALAVAERIANALRSIELEDDTTIAGVRLKQHRWEMLQQSRDTRLAQLAADTWCAAFFAVKQPGTPSITDKSFRALSEDHTEDPAVVEVVTTLADHYRFLHPHLAFPDVFTPDPDDDNGWRGGFDLVLGNPPWDTLSPDQREFFARYHAGMRSLSPQQQDEVVNDLLTDATIAANWDAYRRDLFASAHYFKVSGRYTMFADGNLGKGDFNIYRMFVEVALRLTRKGGYATQIVPGGLYGGANASAIRKYLLDRCELRMLWGLINTTRNWFPKADIDRFAAYVARPGGRTGETRVQFGLAKLEDLLANPIVALAADEIRTREPATYAISDIRNSAELTANTKMYHAAPPFGKRISGMPQRHYQREIDMGNDRELFTTDPEGLAVYEGRMIDHYDYRAKTYHSGHGNSSKWDERSFGDALKAITPQWRVLRSDVPTKLGDRIDSYRVGFGDVANPRNERSFCCTLIPPGVVCGHKVPTLKFEDDYSWAYVPFLALANSFPMDWLARSRLSSPTMSYTLLDSLPIARLPLVDDRTQRLAPLVLSLMCTGQAMTGFWNLMTQFGWTTPLPEGVIPASALLDSEGRDYARAEIDAVVAKLVYGLSRYELDFILDTFVVLKRREEKKYNGEFRTKRLVLDWYDKV